MRIHFLKILLVLMVVSIGSTQAQAYMGPGAGLSAIGSLVSVVSALLLAIAGFVWYPLKRLLRRGRRRPAAPTAERAETAGE